MLLKYVEIQNILSIGSVFLNLDLKDLVLLDGWNYDDDTANAAGKTAILNAICFGIYGKLPRKITASNILREGTREGYVKVGLQVGNDVFEVKRYKPNNLLFYKNGVQLEISQEEFEGFIKLSYENFLLVQYYPQESSRLISLNDSEKKDFFLNLMNYNFESIKQKSDLKIKTISKQLNDLKLNKAGYTHSIEAYKEQIINEEEIKEQIQSLNIEQYEQQLKEIQAQQIPTIDKYEELLESLLIEKNEIKDLQRQNTEINHRVNDINEQISLLKEDETNIISCPTCATEITLDGVLVSLHKSHVDKQIQTLNTKKDKLLSKLVSQDEIEEQIQKNAYLIKKCKLKKENTLLQIQSIKQSISTLENKIQNDNNQINLLKQQIKNNEKVKNKILQQQQELLDIDNKINNLTQVLLISETISDIFSPAGAASYVLESIVETFNEYLKKYIDLIWPNASYCLNTFKENKNKEVKTKFSEKFLINGKERNIGALSGGEYKCLSLAMDFAILDIVESTLGTSISPVILDEPFNNLDVSNRKRVLDVLEKIAHNRCIIVVDHASESKAMFSQIILVTKTNGISSI